MLWSEGQILCSKKWEAIYIGVSSAKQRGGRGRKSKVPGITMHSSERLREILRQPQDMLEIYNTGSTHYSDYYRIPLKPTGRDFMEQVLLLVRCLKAKLFIRMSVFLNRDICEMEEIIWFFSQSFGMLRLQVWIGKVYL